MNLSSHWRFSLPDFAVLYLVTLTLWALFYLIAGDQLRSWTEMETKHSRTETALFMLKVGVLWGLLLASGMTLSKRVGIEPISLHLPSSSMHVAQKAVAVIGRGIIWGLAVAIVFELLTRLLYSDHLNEWNAETRFQNWRSFLAASIGAALGEEALFRLFLFPLVAWLIGLAWKNPDGLPAIGAMWTSFVAVSLLFASTHLIVVKEFGGFTPTNIMCGMFVFTAPALLLCLAFWKHGIETAMIAHASGLIFGWLMVSTLAAIKTT